MRVDAVPQPASSRPPTPAGGVDRVGEGGHPEGGQRHGRRFGEARSTLFQKATDASEDRNGV